MQPCQHLIKDWWISPYYKKTQYEVFELFYFEINWITNIMYLIYIKYIHQLIFNVLYILTFNRVLISTLP
jgi:hypothetical protein